MADNEEKRSKNEVKKGKGANLIGKGGPNNFALPTSKQPSPEAKSNGWAVRNRLIKGAKEIAEFAESTKSQTVIVDGQEVEMSMIAHAFYKQLKKAIDDGNTQAFLAYIQATQGLKTNHGFTDSNGNPVSIFEKLIISGAKLV